ncbi:MAG: hypothetical protein LUM44_07770 [Pyrinomonadaceae bacterium]|nr:hypothetical protein [Pyrinomonadaceae bacterium]
MDILKKSTKVSEEDFAVRYSRNNDFWLSCIDCSYSPAYSELKQFTHKNAGNMGLLSDISFQTALQFAVEVQNSENIFVFGHNECQILRLSLDESGKRFDFLNNWAVPLSHFAFQNQSLPDDLNFSGQLELISRLNVLKQVLNIGDSAIIKKRWKQGARVKISALFYDSHSGSIQDLGFSVESSDQLNLQKNIFQRRQNEIYSINYYRKQCGNSV